MSNLDISINDIINIIAATEIAINKKVYTKEQINKFFPSWNNIASSLEKHKRQMLIEELYRDPVVVQPVAPVTTDSELNVAHIPVPDA